MHTQVRVGRARQEDRPAMERLLVSAGFGTHGLDDSRSRWVVARLGDEVIGCGGIALTGSSAVLDGVAIAASHRRRSVGSTLVGVLLDEAAQNGAAYAYTRTREAGGFFRRLRWRNVSRTEALEQAGLTVEGESQAFVVSLSERALANRAERALVARLDSTLNQ
jgi:N-acetylglutamate synthase-like GNAT family acetyltransferase